MAAAERRVFRSSIGSSEILAISPKAIGSEFDVPEVQSPSRPKNGIAIVDIRGPLEHHTTWWWDNYEAITQRVKEAFSSDKVRAVVLRIDSPGGDAAGVLACHHALRKASKRAGKPLYAYADEMAASAGYAIACAAKEIWTSESGVIGSIGVIGTLRDRTAANKKAGIRVELIVTGSHKTDGNPDGPMTDEAIAEQQLKVDELGAQFFRVVSGSRGLSTKAVQKLQARTFLGKSAVEKKLADGIGSFEAFLKHVSKGSLDDSQNHETIETEDGQSKDGQARTGDEPMKLTKQGLSAVEAVKTAKSDEEKAKASIALAELISAKKFKRCKKTEETEEEDDEDAEDEEDSEDEEDEEDSEDEEDDEDEEDSEDEPEETTEGSESSTDARSHDSDARKMLSAKSGLYTADRLYRLGKQITGKSKLQDVFTALAGIGDRVKEGDKLRGRVVKLENEARSARVDGMLAKARREGRVTKPQIASLRTQGMRDPKWLRLHLATLPKLVTTLEDGAARVSPQALASDPLASLTPDQRALVRSSAMAMNKSEAEVAKDMIEKANKSNAAQGGPRF